MRKLTLNLCFVIFLILFTSWGFYAHKRINEHAVFLLPAEMAVFYKKNIHIITNKAVDADKRCYIDTIEGPRHYIDLDKFDEIDSIPIHWTKAKEKYTERKLLAQGIIPWQINRVYIQLVEAFKNLDYKRIIQASADLGHYIADAHVPLHTTSNYNGQYSNQLGIHAFWETRLPEMFATRYNHFVGAVKYIESPLEEAWNIVKSSNILVDSVLNIEKELSKSFKESEVKAYLQRNNQLVFTYSDNYAEAYHQALNGMVERRYRQSIWQVANFWYSAWVDAGQPKLQYLIHSIDRDVEDIDVSNKKNLGREEWHE